MNSNRKDNVHFAVEFFKNNPTVNDYEALEMLCESCGRTSDFFSEFQKDDSQKYFCHHCHKTFPGLDPKYKKMIYKRRVLDVTINSKVEKIISVTRVV